MTTAANLTKIVRKYAALEALAASAVMTKTADDARRESHANAEGAALALGCSVTDIIAAGIDFFLAAEAAGVHPSNYAPEPDFAARRIAAYCGRRLDN